VVRESQYHPSELFSVVTAVGGEEGDMVSLMSEYRLYCDAGGGTDHGFIVVAGYLSTFKKWLHFQDDWNELLATFSVPYFHMKEFAQSKGPFVAWKGDEPKRASFMSRAARIIVKRVERSFGCVVRYPDFEKVNELYHLDTIAGNPYALAGRTCAARAGICLGDLTGMVYVFEDGDVGKGELMRILERDGHPAPIFRPSRDQIRNGRLNRGVIPLQAADFAAYEMRKTFKDDPREEWPLYKYRKSMRALADVPSVEGDWSKYEEQDLIKLCETFPNSRRPVAASSA
jgi:hypothetical protein